MKHRITILFFFTALIAAPQSSHPKACARSAPALQNLPYRTDTESEAAATPRQKERLFLSNIEKFIATWSALAHEYNEKGTFNVKKAKEVSKAFHDLEKTEGWPHH